MKGKVKKKPRAFRVGDVVEDTDPFTPICRGRIILLTRVTGGARCNCAPWKDRGSDLFGTLLYVPPYEGGPESEFNVNWLPSIGDEVIVYSNEARLVPPEKVNWYKLIARLGGLHSD